MNNKLFALSEIKKETTVVSKVKQNRTYLISDRVKNEFNLYRQWHPFESNGDSYPVRYDVNGRQVKDVRIGQPAAAIRSLFNKAGAVLVGKIQNMAVDPENPAAGNAHVTEMASNWRISLNAPLMDNPEIRTKMKINSGCSVRELVEASEAGTLGREIYSYSDFMYCKHLGQMPNTYMITLRRFPIPVDDYIITAGTGPERKDKSLTSQNMQSIGCMVTWLGCSGNDMGEILKYSVSMPFKEQQAKWEDASVDADSGKGVLNSIAAAMDPAYRNQYMKGYGGTAFNAYVGKMFGCTENGVSVPGHRDQNKIYGPVDAIKTVAMRSEDGLKYNHSIKLVFEYELRSYDGVNGRQAMLELISNILNVVYSTGTFWGGGYRGAGMHQNNIFANLNVFKTSGGFTDFVDAMQKDYQNLSGMAKAKVASAGGGIQGLINLAKQALNQLGGMIIGGTLNKLGRPARGAANSLLSPAPVGFWHLTIGNPHHPIMSMGNMILNNTTIEHTGPLGLDEFPTGLKVTCELKPGKGRDIAGIEALYMKGQDRIYTSMSEKVFEMYKYADLVNGEAPSPTTTWGDLKEAKELEERSFTYPTAVQVTAAGTTPAEQQTSNKETKTKTNGSEKEKEEKTTADWDLQYEPKRTLLTPDDIKALKDKQNLIQKFFGEYDAYSIYFAAAEQEKGATIKTVKQNANGQSTNATQGASANNNTNKNSKKKSNGR